MGLVEVSSHVGYINTCKGVFCPRLAYYSFLKLIMVYVSLSYKQHTAGFLQEPGEKTEKQPCLSTS